MKIPYTDRRGVNAGNCRTTEDTIHKICALLQDKPTVSFKVIARMCKVGKEAVRAIADGRNWAHISDGYDFTARNLYNRRWGPLERRQTPEQTTAVQQAN